jgi:hypothetical protein
MYRVKWWIFAAAGVAVVLLLTPRSDTQPQRAVVVRTGDQPADAAASVPRTADVLDRPAPTSEEEERESGPASSDPDSPPPTEYECIAILEPRMLTFSCEEDPQRPARTVEQWLDLLGPEAVRSRSAGEARLYRQGREWADDYDDYLLRWRKRGNALDVQIVDPQGWLNDTRFTRFMDALAFAMEAKGVLVEPGPSSGCTPPYRTPDGAPVWSEAVTAEFEAMGLDWIDEDAGTSCNVRFYGRPGAPAEWAVAWDGLDGGDPTIELSHLSDPFDAQGERDVLVRILKRMGVSSEGL